MKVLKTGAMEKIVLVASILYLVTFHLYKQIYFYKMTPADISA